MTLPELLKQTEVELNTPSGRALPGAHLVTPNTKISTVPHAPDSTREWRKDDWKLLDACFTDERLSVGAKGGRGDEYLANVNEVKIEDVVMRYISMMGGAKIVDALGQPWSL
jgi:hypothetical protein